jgi:hypothetical protein
LNPGLPVLDSQVLSVMRTQLPERGNWRLLRAGSLGKRIDRAEEIYRSLRAVVSSIQAHPEFHQLVDSFDREHGKSKLTDTKKLDLLLWRYGAAVGR